MPSLSRSPGSTRATIVASGIASISPAPKTGGVTRGEAAGEKDSIGAPTSSAGAFDGANDEDHQESSGGCAFASTQAPKSAALVAALLLLLPLTRRRR